MSISPVIACSLVITALASAQGASAQNRPATRAGPAGSTGLDCGGAFYAPVSGGYQVIPPPIGAMTWSLPSGAVDQNVNGISYFAYGGAYYRLTYSWSGVYYEVVATPA